MTATVVVIAAVIAVVISPIISAIVTAVMVMIVVVVFTALIPAIAVLLPVVWSIFAVVPVVLHKIDAFAASVVLVTIPAPMPGVILRNAQVDRRALHHYVLDHSRLRIDDSRRRRIADVETAVKAGFAYVDRDADIGSERRGNHADGDC